MSDPLFDERFEFVLRWLQRRRAHVAAAVMRLGRVQMTKQIATAAIVANDKDVWLYFNPEFLGRIDNAELAGVLTHEALHFVLAHPKRVIAIQNQRDRFYFQLACEAVINDLINASFGEMKLPGQPVTGTWLIGRDTSQMSAEQVMQVLSQQRGREGTALDVRLATAQAIDDHSVWEPDDDDSGRVRNSSPGRNSASASTLSMPHSPIWTDETSKIITQLLNEVPPGDPCYGTAAAGALRAAPPAPKCRKSLAQFLNETVSAAIGYDTLWTVPNRKMLAFYPRVILPSYETHPRWNILIAIDASGSIPDEFLSGATAFARQRTPRTRVTLVSFDTVCYETSPDAVTLRGGGGTHAQAVEEYIQHRMKEYPDFVFLLTDGWTPPPSPKYPTRWFWLLPPWGSTEAMPTGSVAEFFMAEELAQRPARQRPTRIAL